MKTHIAKAIAFIRYPFGVVFILAGIDKVFSTNLITQWSMYISPEAASVLGPNGITPFLMFIGVIEIVAGVMLLWRWARIASYIGAAWLVIIAINLMLLGTLDIAIRDILLACALISLSFLLYIRPATTAE